MSEFDTYSLLTDRGFCQGIGSLIDFRGTLLQYKLSATPEEADVSAMQSDWKIVGEEIRSAIETFTDERIG